MWVITYGDRVFPKAPWSYQLRSSPQQQTVSTFPGVTMTFVSMYINHKLRPTYRQWGHSLGERIANVVDADPAQREKIITRTTIATSVGLSLGCALLTADAVGFVHAAATSMDADTVHSVATGAATVHGQAAQSVLAAHAQAVGQAGAGQAGHAASGNPAAALAGFNQQSNIMASVGQDQANALATTATSDVVDASSDVSF
jgi:hypothetical protein